RGLHLVLRAALVPAAARGALELHRPTLRRVDRAGVHRGPAQLRVFGVRAAAQTLPLPVPSGHAHSPPESFSDWGSSLKAPGHAGTTGGFCRHPETASATASTRSMAPPYVGRALQPSHD